MNEWCHEVVFRSMTEEQKNALSGPSKFGISLGSGVIAGFAAAILSHVSALINMRLESITNKTACLFMDI